MDEGGEVAGELGVGHGRAKHPLVALCGDLLGGSGHDNLRRLRLCGDLGSGKARRTADASDHQHNVIAGGQPFGDVDSFFWLAGVVGVDGLDLACRGCHRRRSFP